jgi:very-short-patch-repair endonuclease
MRRGARNLTQGKLRQIRRLRKSMSFSERLFWHMIRKRKIGFLFRTQHPIGAYVMDFYWPEARLCIEIDGEQHRLGVERDATRDAVLLGEGILTVRIPSLNLFEPSSVKFGGWLDQIIRLCEQRTGRSP